MIEAVEYTNEWRREWDDLVNAARNGFFFFLRDYFEYHKDRFEEASLLFLKDGCPYALCPLSRHGSDVVSYGGLTFGGILSPPCASLADIEAIGDAMCVYARRNGWEHLTYKVPPRIYHQCPSDEDVFWLHSNGAGLVRRDVNTVIDLINQGTVQLRRKRGQQKALAAGVRIEMACGALREFWRILEDNLEARHSLRPVHTVAEIEYLQNMFPQNIELHGAFLDDALVAGVLTYRCGAVVHTQYIGANPAGRACGALDALLLALIGHFRLSYRFFSMGISTYENGTQLNDGLLQQKEGFGGRAIVHDFYQLRF